MVNAFNAVKAALNPIAAVKIPAGFTAGSATFDAGGSAAACGAVSNATIASYAWTATGAVQIVSGQANSAVNVMSTGTGSLTLVVTDSAGNTDSAVVNFTATGHTVLRPQRPARLPQPVSLP